MGTNSTRNPEKLKLKTVDALPFSKNASHSVAIHPVKKSLKPASSLTNKGLESTKAVKVINTVSIFSPPITKAVTERYKKNPTPKKVSISKAYLNKMLSKKSSNASFVRSNQDIKRQKNNITDIKYQNTSQKQINYSDKIKILPSAIIYNILSFLMADINSIFKVSKTWRASFRDSMEEALNPIENGFIKEYSSYLLFINSTLSTYKILFGDTSSTKVVRIIKFECLPVCLNFTVTISYTYFYEGEQNMRLAKYQFECIPVKKRVTWIHTNECQINPKAANSHIAYSAPVSQACINDTIEISVPLCSLSGVTDLTMLRWKSLILTPTYTENALTYKKDKHLGENVPVYTKFVADLTRICDEEDAEIDWGDITHIIKYNKKAINRIEGALSIFKLDRLLISMVDKRITKYVLVANKVGCINEDILGISVLVVGVNQSCRVEVKMVGLIIDRNSPIEMRIGDVLVFYNAND